MQQAAGNHAVNGFLDRRRIMPTATAVQRDIENEFFRDCTTEVDKNNAKAFFAAFDAAVKAAYTYVVSVPSLGAWAGLNGYTRLWSEKWDEFLRGGRPKLMAATFGYVIESLVSSDTEYHPSPPADCRVLTQWIAGGTRPDLVLQLTKGGVQIAWLDLTASASVGHIFDKEGWDRKIGIYAEVTYPSLDPGDLALMKQNKANKGTLTKEEFEKRQNAARAAYRIQKDHWLKMGTDKYSVTALKGSIKRRGGRMATDVKPELKRSLIKAKLERGFATEIDDEKNGPEYSPGHGSESIDLEFHHRLQRQRTCR